MAHELYTRTNQKIFFAGLSLESWRKAEETASMNSQGLIQAEREACLFHLYGALLGLCHEIAGYYRSPGADAPVVEAFLTRSVLEPRRVGARRAAGTVGTAEYLARAVAGRLSSAVPAAARPARPRPIRGSH